ncbi:integrase [Sinomonas sp. RB5]
MENFYGWAVEENLVRTRPFRYRSAYVSTGPLAGQTVEKNQARSKTGSRAASIRSLSPDFADLFIEVGLGGKLPDGTPDPAFGGRTAARNRAVAALVRSSGLRRQEFSNLLLWEVPQSAPLFGDFVALRVSPQIAKGARERTTWASSGALDAVHDYAALERSLGATQWRPSNPLYVSEPSSHSGLLNGSRVEWHRLTISQRRRLVSPDGGSALLFRGRAGSPLGENSWRYAFDTAVKRCRQFDPRFPDVTPHTLRHTFAIETLNLLTRAAMSRAEKLAKVAGTDPMLMAILRRNDPLLIVRDMLGHKSVQTTEIYLSLQDPDTILSDAELALLADEGETEDLRWIS